ncbi:solute:sodium symporter family transporter [Salmonella enterica subsp. enterica serovar Kottbus]|nr:solute:sodium symporter family transporter [Salmonella enterica subsp. enterica serovar Newport]EBY2753059.1 solute:sodium symporter family transporter [Salmonella enterica subsp. enterica serovar Kottbus]
MLTILSCFFVLIAIAIFTYYKTKGTVKSASGYFLGGRGLTAVYIIGSLILTNISTEQLIGESGIVYFGNMTAMAWEVWAVRGMILLALLFLPMYLGGAFTTIPEFLDSHYGVKTRRMTTLLFMFGYIFVWSPTVLYGGSLALMKILHFESVTGISQLHSMIIICSALGIIGAVYAIFGGLKAIAVADTVNGCLLIFIGLLIPVLGLVYLGNMHGGGILNALKYIATNHSEKLNAIGGTSKTDAIPFAAIFTGLMVTATFYWGTNQFIVQRALGAKNLKTAQKGVLLAGFFKMFVPVIAMFPGIIAFHIFGPGLNPRELAYPLLVNKILPAPLLGLFMAVLLGVVFSAYNAILNSAITVFAKDIYSQIKKDATEREVLFAAKIFGVCAAVLTISIAPALLYAPDGIFIFLQQFTGFISIPIVTLVLLGLFSKKIRIQDNFSVIMIVVHVIAYYALVWPLNKYIHIHWMHVYGILFIIELIVLITYGLLSRKEKISSLYRGTESNPPDVYIQMTPWKYAMLTSGILLSCAVLMYIVFSPVGVAYTGSIVSPSFYITIVLALFVCVIFCIALHWFIQPRYEKYIINHFSNRSKVESKVELSKEI